MAVRRHGSKTANEIENWKFELLLCLAFWLEINEIKGQNLHEYIKEHVHYEIMTLHGDRVRKNKVEMARKDGDDEIE